MISNRDAVLDTHGPASVDGLLDERALSKLRWRCRRGMLENDLFLDRFFGCFGSQLTTRQGRALNELMELDDNDLLDLQLGRRSLKQIDPTLDREDVVEVLRMLRAKP